jgi:ABC-type amino acid transport substrate-binding protein/serine phosphatase RsbU (regulator of sigma subunit)
MKILITLIGVLIYLGTNAQDLDLTLEESEWVENHDTVFFGYDPGWRPLEFIDENGEHAGVTADYLTEIGEKSGINFQPYPNIKDWTQAEQLALDKKVHFLPALAQNPRRETFLDFTKSFFSYSFVIVSQKESEFIGGVNDLTGKNVAIVEGYQISDLLVADSIAINFIKKKTINDCLLAVSTGEVEATVTNVIVASHYMNYGGYDNLKIASSTPYPAIDIKMGVMEGDSLFISILEKGMDAISRKEKSDIMNKWITVQYEHGVDMKKVYRIAIISISVVVFIFGTFYYWNRKLKKEVSRRKEAEQLLRNSFNEISEQKKIIELKSDEVMDSIKYAKRLQDAILPPLDIVDQKFEKNFIYYQPKDIVAGDFYWMESVTFEGTGNEVNFIAAADCTGHGVPGAMVSVVCSNALDQSVLQYMLRDPGKILDKTTDLVIERFDRSREEVKDGMDIAMVSIEKLNENQSKIRFAGAYNNLWITSEREDLGIRSIVMESEFSEEKLFEIKANKQPIGKYEYSVPFKTTEIILEKGDRLYLASDGYADQFGGEKGKKFKTKNFKELILRTTCLALAAQKSVLIEEFEKWKGDFEQLDDICIIGIEI